MEKGNYKRTKRSQDKVLELVGWLFQELGVKWHLVESVEHYKRFGVLKGWKLLRSLGMRFRRAVSKPMLKTLFVGVPGSKSRN